MRRPVAPTAPPTAARSSISSPITRLSCAVPPADVWGEIVPIEFTNPSDKEIRFRFLCGLILEKAEFLRDFLKEVLADMVYEQKLPFRVELLSKRTTEGLPLLERSIILQGLEVSMANIGIIRGAFVVWLPQLEKHPMWKIWPDTPKDPHITLAFIGDNMYNITAIQKNLILLAGVPPSRARETRGRQGVNQQTRKGRLRCRDSWR